MFAIRRLAIYFTIIGYLAVLSMWFSPYQNLQVMVEPLMSLSGFRQSWAMFAAGTWDTAHYDVTTVYRDGLVRFYEWPRMEKLSLGDKYRLEKYGKFCEVISNTYYTCFWPSMGRFFAKAFADTQNPPFMTFFSAKSAAIPRAFIRQSELPEKTKVDTYFIYKVPNQQ